MICLYQYSKPYIFTVQLYLLCLESVPLIVLLLIVYTTVISIL